MREMLFGSNNAANFQLIQSSFASLVPFWPLIWRVTQTEYIMGQLFCSQIYYQPSCHGITQRTHRTFLEGV